jgi:hypothetical protein
MEIEVQEAEVKLAKLKMERVKISASSGSSETTSLPEFESCQYVQSWMEASDGLAGTAKNTNIEDSFERSGATTVQKCFQSMNEEASS